MKTLTLLIGIAVMMFAIASAMNTHARLWFSCAMTGHFIFDIVERPKGIVVTKDEPTVAILVSEFGVFSSGKCIGVLDKFGGFLPARPMNADTLVVDLQAPIRVAHAQVAIFVAALSASLALLIFWQRNPQDPKIRASKPKP